MTEYYDSLEFKKEQVLDWLETVRKSVENSISVEGSYELKKPSLGFDYINMVYPRYIRGTKHIRYIISIDVLEK